jgi:DNA (cytosine-5)-methyltransferase 1
MREPPNPTASTLRNLRERAGLSQLELATRTGYSEKTIRRWEIGQCPPRSAVIEYLKKALTGDTARSTADTQSFTFVDLFAGIGGMRKGFESVGGKCVFTSEWD